MRILIRILGWGALALAIVLLAVFALLYVLYPPQKIKDELVPRVESALGRQVDLADAGISFWPPFGVYISGLPVHNRPPAALAHLLHLEYARARVPLWPLFSGRVQFDELSISGLEFD